MASFVACFLAIFVTSAAGSWIQRRSREQAELEARVELARRLEEQGESAVRDALVPRLRLQLSGFLTPLGPVTLDSITSAVRERVKAWAFDRGLFVPLKLAFEKPACISLSLPAGLSGAEIESLKRTLAPTGYLVVWRSGGDHKIQADDGRLIDVGEGFPAGDVRTARPALVEGNRWTLGVTFTRYGAGDWKAFVARNREGASVITIDGRVVARGIVGLQGPDEDELLIDPRSPEPLLTEENARALARALENPYRGVQVNVETIEK
jgi:hypothetical protein